MKKRIMGTIVVAGLLLLASCGPKEGVGPIKLDNTGITPTPIVVPTCTPTATPTPKPSTNPSVTEAVSPTEAPKPTVAPTAVPTVAPTATSTPVPEPTDEPVVPTQTPVPTIAPTEIPDIAPTAVPTVAPTETPTVVPQETVTPVPEVTQAPEPTVTPIVDPKPLVYRGWQQTMSVDEEYLIIFPDMFLDSVVSKAEDELRIDYICAADPAISFRVTYKLYETLEESLTEIEQTENAELISSLEEKRVDFRYQKDGLLHDGVILQNRYAGTLLGTADAEWIDGVMEVVFTYPEEQKNDYETVIYRYFVISSREE